ncbi:putative metalloprotease CJM1_0395 family protein [Salinibius halmophilus]|uniref:putative metalloprotease CJM1_0395 family protein n=1 Tax=Salinibius halmophilus TaxID=1853216 RepID=UPI000E6741C8|nr:putative metalloprotease CJM1_0395 family protein [Salinibius halmophilus]
MAAIAGPSPVVAVPLTALQQVEAVRSGDRSETARAIEESESTTKAKGAEEERSEQQDDNRQSRQRENSLSEIELQQVQELSQRDREVRQHELAHQAAAGQYGGSMKLEYTIGPDGKRYAVAGSVQVDLSREATAEETIEKAEQIQRAAMAPSEPSSQDRMVAQQAVMMEMAARAELLREDRLEQEASREEASEELTEQAEAAEDQKDDSSREYQQRFDQLTETLLALEKYRDEIDDISERFQAIA